MPQTIIGNWLERLTRSVEKQDLAEHMALISERVQVYGLPGGQIVNYQQWENRRYTEFNRHQLASLDYRLLNIKTITARRLKFDVEEIMQASNGVRVVINKGIILECETDEQWRVVEENIHYWKTEQATKIS